MNHHADQDLNAAIDQARRTVDHGSDENRTPALYYGSAGEFVRQYLRNVSRRHFGAAASTGSGPPGRGSTTRPQSASKRSGA